MSIKSLQRNIFRILFQIFVCIDDLLGPNFVKKFHRDSGSSNFTVLCNNVKQKFSNGRHFETVKHLILFLHRYARLDDLYHWCNFYAKILRGVYMYPLLGHKWEDFLLGNFLYLSQQRQTDISQGNVCFMIESDFIWQYFSFVINMHNVKLKLQLYVSLTQIYTMYPLLGK